VARLLGGGFKHIKKNKKQEGMTIINFKTDIDRPDVNRVSDYV
jgi:hypothetical protein